jgi:hypothetical protein
MHFNTVFLQVVLHQGAHHGGEIAPWEAPKDAGFSVAALASGSRRCPHFLDFGFIFLPVTASKEKTHGTVIESNYFDRCSTPMRANSFASKPANSLAGLSSVLLTKRTFARNSFYTFSNRHRLRSLARIAPYVYPVSTCQTVLRQLH